MKRQLLLELHKSYIEGTRSRDIVIVKRILLCHLTNIVKKNCNFLDCSVYITTRALKHVYDKRPAEEYDYIIRNLHTITKYPDFIYKNKDGKKGQVCLIKTLKNEKYFCSLESGEDRGIEVVTFFRIRKENYIKKYELLWSWRNDKSSS